MAKAQGCAACRGKPKWMAVSSQLDLTPISADPRQAKEQGPRGTSRIFTSRKALGSSVRSPGQGGHQIEMTDSLAFLLETFSCFIPEQLTAV